MQMFFVVSTFTLKPSACLSVENHKRKTRREEVMCRDGALSCLPRSGLPVWRDGHTLIYTFGVLSVVFCDSAASEISMAFFFGFMPFSLHR